MELPGEEELPACVHETHQVPQVPKVVFVCSIVGRLKDLTTTCISTFHNAADTFVLNNDDVLYFALPPVEPLSLCWQMNISNGQGKVYPRPPLHCPFWRPQHYFLGGTSTPLLLQWPEKIQTEVLGAQNSAETPDSLGWKRCN